MGPNCFVSPMKMTGVSGCCVNGTSDIGSVSRPVLVVVERVLDLEAVPHNSTLLLESVQPAVDLEVCPRVENINTTAT